MISLDTEVKYVKGVGEKKAGFLAKLGIFSLRDLLRHFPREYEDRRTVKRLIDILPGESACVEGAVVSAPQLSRIRRGLDIVRCRISDGSATCEVSFFNQSWQRSRLVPGEEYVFYGKFGGDLLRRELTNPVFEPAGEARQTGKIVPVYSMTAGLRRSDLTKLIETALAAAEGQFPEPLPASVRERFGLVDAESAYRSIHFPESDEALADARRRFVFEELFLLSLGLRRAREGYSGTPPHIEPMDTAEFTRVLPFPLTRAQERAISEIKHDLCFGTRPMNRLVQGDVGSGKTVVAAAAAWLACKSGHQTAFMAPTELLAAQHFRTLAPMLSRFGITAELLTGSLTAAQKREAQARIASGEAQLVIGTHALISGGVEFRDLGLVITDEQHRFGVRQRAALAAKGSEAHILVMSATPIPRTLSLIIYGDLDLSVIDELPPGRTPIKTSVISANRREELYASIRRLIGEGRQAYIVCSRVEDGDEPDDGRKAVEEYAKTLREEVFPDLRVEYVHGRMKQKQKDEVMERFAAGEADILVATTVIEVGIDVPNAALMVVENAENFGLSQLHQLRGRVGRGRYESYCVLVRGGGGDAAKERLGVMRDTNDGFRIAESDLKLRGPGDFFGSRQHGLPALRVADLDADAETMMLASEAAAELFRKDPALASPDCTETLAAVRALFREQAMN